MKIGIIGSGLMGGKLGTLFARVGHEVVFSFARTHGKLEALARNAGDNARAGTPHEAAQADAVLLAVHWSRLEQGLHLAGDLARKVVMTCCVPLDITDTELVVAHKDSGAEALARQIPRARVVAVFQTVPSEALFAVFEARNQAERPDLLYCGDDGEAKAVAASLMAEVGFNPLDAGPLRVARYTEPFAMLTAQLAYGPNCNPKMIYRFNRY